MAIRKNQLIIFYYSAPLCLQVLLVVIKKIKLTQILL